MQNQHNLKTFHIDNNEPIIILVTNDWMKVTYIIITLTITLDMYSSPLSNNGWQLAKMKKSIPDMSLPWNL